MGSVIQVDSYSREQPLFTFAGALAKETAFMTDTERLQPICDEVNLLANQARADAAANGKEPDFRAAIEALKKVMDHTSEDTKAAIDARIAANPDGAEEQQLALAHHGRQVTGTADIGHAETGKMYQTANMAGNLLLAPLASVLPAIMGPGTATSIANGIAVLGTTAAIPMFHTISHMCTLPAQALVDNGGCTLRPDDTSLGLKSIVAAENALKKTLETASEMCTQDPARTGEAREMVEAEFKKYKNSEGAANINKVNQLPQSHVRLVRTLANIGAAGLAYMGHPVAACGVQYAAAIGGQIGLMAASRKGGIAKEEEKLKMLLQLNEEVTPALLVKHFQGPLKARAKLAGEVLTAHTAELEQQIAEAEGFHSKPVKLNHAKLAARLQELPTEIEAMKATIVACKAELGESAEAEGDATLKQLEQDLQTLEKEQATAQKKFQELDKDHQAREKKLAAEASPDGNSSWLGKAGKFAGAVTGKVAGAVGSGVHAVAGTGVGKFAGAVTGKVAGAVGSGAHAVAGTVASGLGKTVSSVPGGKRLVGGLSVLNEGLSILKEETKIYASSFGEELDLETKKATLAAIKKDIDILKKLHTATDPEGEILKLSDDGKATLELFAATARERGEPTHSVFGSLSPRPNTAHAAMRHGGAKLKNPAESARMLAQKEAAVGQLGGFAGSQSTQMIGAVIKGLGTLDRPARPELGLPAIKTVQPAVWAGVQVLGLAISTNSNYRTNDLIDWKNITGTTLRNELSEGKIEKKYNSWAPLAAIGTASGKVFGGGLQAGAIANFVGAIGGVSRVTGWGSAEKAAETFLSKTENWDALPTAEPTPPPAPARA